MAVFILNSEITIGSLKFSGVNEVRIRRSLHSYADTAYIKLPSIAKILRGRRASDTKVWATGTLFEDGDPVLIKLGYNGDLKEEFRGFVKRRNLNTTMEIECEGYVRKLRLDIDVNKQYKETTASALLELLTKDKAGNSTGIKVKVADDLPFIGVRLPNVNGVEICDSIKKFSANMLNIFFIAPDTLWCGLTYTPYTRGEDPFGLGRVNFRLGYNVIKDNNLKERVTNGERVQVLFHSTMVSGKKIMTASADKTAARKHKAMLNNIGDEQALQKLANEKQYRMNYAGYEGNINAFLQPYCLPGYMANVVDSRYPERNGLYMIETTEVTFGVNGAGRKVELGPLLGFDPKPKKTK